MLITRTHTLSLSLLLSRLCVSDYGPSKEFTDVYSNLWSLVGQWRARNPLPVRQSTASIPGISERARERVRSGEGEGGPLPLHAFISLSLNFLSFNLLSFSN